MDPSVGARHLATYTTWLACQPLSAHTRRAYRGRVRGFLDWLGPQRREGDVSAAGPARDYAVRDYKLFLKTDHGAKPSSVNLTLAALDHFYRFLGAGRPSARREELPQQAPRALDPGEQRRCPRTRCVTRV